MNVEHRTLNVQHPIMYSVNLKKGYAKQNHPARFDSAELFDPEFFSPVLTTEGLVAGCDSLVLDSIKRSAINIRRSMLDVRCSTFNLLAVPARRSFPKDLATRVPDTRNLQYAALFYQRAWCPSGTAFVEHSLGKSVAPI